MSSPAFAGEGDQPEAGGGAPPSPACAGATSPRNRGEEKNDLPLVDIFTDGACRGNPGPGGWAALLRTGETEREISGGEKLTTNNRMELTAAIEALNALRRPCAVELHTDSNYVRDGITRWIHSWQRNGWRTSGRKPVKNADLWEALLEAAERHDVRWHWVRGHSGHPENERVDALACAEADKQRS